MGEQADYMLNGDDCAGCGMVFMDDKAAGIPRYCKLCKQEGHEVPAPNPNKPQRKRTVPCPACNRRFFGQIGLAKHRAMNHTKATGETGT